MINKSFSKLSKSSKSVEYQTPIEFFNKLNKIFDFKLDPCTTKYNPLGTEKFYTKEQNGLDYEWDENTYVNPPFGRGIDKWINMMYEEHLKYPSKVYIMLLPARTDTVWFQELIMERTRQQEIYFIKGRLKFINSELNSKSEPHIIGSMLWILGATRAQEVYLSYNIPGVLVYGWYTPPPS